MSSVIMVIHALENKLNNFLYIIFMKHQHIYRKHINRILQTGKVALSEHFYYYSPSTINIGFPFSVVS